MAIEEKANSSSPFEPHEWQEGYGLYESGFVQGAKWMIDKALDWIGDNVVVDKFGRPLDVENFRKAMEE